MKRGDLIKALMQPRFKNGLFLGLGILLVAFVFTLGFHTAFVNKKSSYQNNDLNEVIQNTPSVKIPLSREFVRLADRVKGALVNINTERFKDSAHALPKSPFEKFFGDSFDWFETPQNIKRQSLGSGFIADVEGHILTGRQVVENASRIRVRLNDRRSMDAVVVGADPKTNLAVLKITGANLQALHLAKADDVKLGEWVAAFGSSVDTMETMAVGIISGKKRAIGSNSMSYLQTDAAINAENSGGPLINLRGEVVGVNVTIRNDRFAANGIGFAIPSATARKAYQEIVKSGKISRGWLGLQIQEVTPGMARIFGLRHPIGALAVEVDPSGPAYQAGIMPGDVIFGYDGKEIQSANELSAAVAETKVGAIVRLRILRNQKELTLEAAVGERPSAVAGRFRSSYKSGRDRLGIMIENITGEIQKQLNLSSNKGALVIDVSQGSFASQGGILPGDVIHEINHAPVNKAADLLSAAQKLEEGSTVLVKIERQGNIFYLAFDLP